MGVRIGTSTAKSWDTGLNTIGGGGGGSSFEG